MSREARRCRVLLRSCTWMRRCAGTWHCTRVKTQADDSLAVYYCCALCLLFQSSCSARTVPQSVSSSTQNMRGSISRLGIGPHLCANKWKGGSGYCIPSASACVSASWCSSHFRKEADHLQAISYQTNLGAFCSLSRRFMNSMAYAWRSPEKEFIRYATNP